jgi:hypothetical protein
MSKKTDTKREVKRTGHKLIGDFPTNKKKYKTGDMIQLTPEGVTYLRKLKKIK